MGRFSMAGAHTMVQGRRCDTIYANKKRITVPASPAFSVSAEEDSAFTSKRVSSASERAYSVTDLPDKA
jgi:hypothetical protein